MGIIISQDETKSGLSQRITAELREKAERSSLDTKNPDLAKESAYNEGYQATAHYSWIWAILLLVAVATLVGLLVF